MSIRVTFDSDESTKAFATKHGLATPAGNTIDTDFHLLEQIAKDATVTTSADIDDSEHDVIRLMLLVNQSNSQALLL